MRSDSDVVQLLRRLSPATIADWLALKGWTRVEETDERTYWTLGDGADAAVVLVPLGTSFQDYDLRIQQLANEVQRASRQTWDEMLLDLLAHHSDLVSVQSQQETPADGSISLGGGLDFLTGVKDLLRAAAKATAEKRPYFGNRQPNIAERYLASLRLGQTQEGSYVFNVLASISPEIADESDETTEEPALPLSSDLSRTVTRTLIKALIAAHNAAVQYRQEQDFRPFMESIAEGVSADMCDSVLSLLGAHDQSAVRIGVHWARRRPLPDLANSEVTFTREDFSPLAAASARFKSAERVPGATVTGVIRQMRREEITEGTPFVVTLHVLNAPVEARAIRVRLEWRHFHTATAAFDAGQQVTVTGDLEREGNFYWLYNPTDVVVGSGRTNTPGLRGQGILDDDGP